MHKITKKNKQPMVPGGAGISLRSHHFETFLSSIQPVDWLEIVADQFLNSQGILRDKLHKITQNYPVNLHMVSLSLAGTDPINTQYLKQIAALAESIHAFYISDHLCWSSHNNQYGHDLLPFPFTTRHLKYIANRINYVQQVTQRPLLIENLSHYVNLNSYEQTEADALNYLCEQTGCGILLDVNNIYVSCSNLNTDARQWIRAIDPNHVKQIHLAGHHVDKNRLIDTHGSAVSPAVWSLYEDALKQFGPVPTCLEWDNNIPSWPVMIKHQQKIKCLLKKCIGTQSARKDIPSKVILPHNPPESLRIFQNKHWHNLHSSTDIPDENPWSVHQNSMRMQRLSALQSTFPSTEKIMGKTHFKQIAIAYLLQVPSTDPDIGLKNNLFCQFIKQNNLDQAILDLAQFEWHWYLAFHSTNHADINLEMLANAISENQENITLKQIGGLQLFHALTNAQNNWASQQDECDSHSKKTKTNPYSLEKNYYYTFHQRHGLVVVNQIDAISYACLKQLNQPTTLKRWYELCANHHNIPPHLAAQLYQCGLIQLHTNHEEPK